MQLQLVQRKMVSFVIAHILKQHFLRCSYVTQNVFSIMTYRVLQCAIMTRQVDALRSLLTMMKYFCLNV